MVKSIGIIRKVDELGRVVLPIETGRILGIVEKGSVEILVNEDSGQIIPQKASETCMKCGATEDLKEVTIGNYICPKCIEDLK